MKFARDHEKIKKDPRKNKKAKVIPEISEDPIDPEVEEQRAIANEFF